MMNKERSFPKGPSRPGITKVNNISSPKVTTNSVKLDSEKPTLISTVQLSRPFLTRQQIKYAQNRTISNISIYDQRRNQIFHFLLKICISLKFPMRCLESAMIYYQRYYLYNEFDTTSYYDIAITALFITSKNEDTIKKLRDIIMIANQIKNTIMKPELLEQYRKKIIRIEFKLLETMSFDFRFNHIEEYLVKIGKDLKISKEICSLAWLISIDSFQIDIGLKIPSHSIALASLIIACKLKNHDLKFKAETYYTTDNSINEGLIDLLDLYVHHFNFSNLVGFYPEFKDKFINIKLFYAHAKGFSDQDIKILEKDEYFKERDFSNGERRYMLGNQKKRLFNEIQN